MTGILEEAMGDLQACGARNPEIMAATHVAFLRVINAVPEEWRDHSLTMGATHYADNYARAEVV